MDERLKYLTENERGALQALVERLQQRYGDNLLRVALFGSKARGDFDDESDLDVLVVVRERDYWSCWREIADLSTRLLLETGVNVSAVVRDAERYQWWMVHHAPIYNAIQRDGIELWTTRNEPSLRSG